MRRFLWAAPLLVIVPALWAADDPKDDKDKPKQEKPATPVDEFRTLVTEFQTARLEHQKAVRAAKSDEDRQEAAKKQPNVNEYSKKFLEIAEKNPKDAVAVDALIWVVTNTRANTQDGRKALHKLVTDHGASEKIGDAVLMIAQTPDAEKSLRSILEQNQNRRVRALATYGLGRSFVVQSLSAGQQGKSEEAKKLSEEARSLLATLLDEYLDVPGPGGSMLDLTNQLIAYVPRGAELLKDVLKKDLTHDVKGNATHALAQALIAHAEKEGNLESSKEAASVLQDVIDNFADVRGARGPLADAAKSELEELNVRGIGVPVPEIEAEDTEGTEFKLSDYRGKVVVLDFWGHW